MTKVVVANKYVDAKGTHFKGGETVEVPNGEALDLIDAGKARWPEKQADKPADKPVEKGAKNG